MTVWNKFALWMTLLFTLAGAVPVHAQRPAARAAKRIAEAQRKADAELARLLRLSPDERERILSYMAPERRARVEARLAELEQMNAGEREQLGRRLDSFRALPDEDRANLRELARQLNNLPPLRRRLVRREVVTLRRLPETERQSRLSSDSFRREFSAVERELVEKLSTVALPIQ